MSFLEFGDPSLWPIFEESVEDRLKGHQKVHNQFISRDAIEAWAFHAGLNVLSFRKSEEADDWKKLNGLWHCPGCAKARERKPCDT